MFKLLWRALSAIGALVATVAVQHALVVAWRAATGRKPPEVPEDPTAPGRDRSRLPWRQEPRLAARGSSCFEWPPRTTGRTRADSPSPCGRRSAKETNRRRPDPSTWLGRGRARRTNSGGTAARPVFGNFWPLPLLTGQHAGMARRYALAAGHCGPLEGDLLFPILVSRSAPRLPRAGAGSGAEGAVAAA